MPRGSSGAGRSSGGGGSGSVSVSGYTRSNGTYVAGYTRSAPSGSASSSQSSSSSAACGGGGGGGGSYGGGSSGSVSVSGYTRSNGTEVAGYTRAAPSSSSSRSSSSAARQSTGTVQVSGYTKTDGTYVAPYTRAAPSASRSGSAGVSSSQTDYNWAEVERALPKVEIKQAPAFKGDQRKRTHYVDNAANRRMGRVGMAIPVQSTAAAAAAAGTGQPATGKQEQNQRIRENLARQTAEEMARYLEELNRQLASATPPSYTPADYAVQTAYDLQQRAAVEEQWTEEGIRAETNPNVKPKSLIIPSDEITVEKTIGRGGFGEVFAARYEGTVVAVKRLHMQKWSQNRINSFKTELKTLCRISHPCIVRLLGAIIEPLQYALVMEYMTRSLFTALFVHEAKFSTPKQREIMLEVGAALAYLHNQRVAHCDMKVENVLLDATDHAKICDFGLSFFRNVADSSTSRCAGAETAPRGQGTPRYSAPEVLRGERLQVYQLFATDVYSFSLVVYEVVVRAEVFIDYTVRQLEKHVGEGDDRPKIPPMLPASLAEFLRSMWAKDPLNRPSMTAVNARFQSLPVGEWGIVSLE